MNTEASSSNAAHLTMHQQAELYLDGLHALAEELNHAMSAIVARSLPDLEDSIGRQIASCARLAEHPGRPLRSQAPEPGRAARLDGDLAARIQAATAHLASLNRRYAALVKHSSDTVRLFAGLFLPYAGNARQGSQMRTHLHTWSCEL
jgi:hypothetical protein